MKMIKAYPAQLFSDLVLEFFENETDIFGVDKIRVSMSEELHEKIEKWYNSE